MAKSPKHTAFIDLELSLADRVAAEWGRHWNKLAPDLDEAIKTRNYEDAHWYVDQISFDPVVASVSKFIETVGMASLLLGASRLASLDKVKIKENRPDRELDNAIAQMKLMLSRNATLALQKQGHVLLHDLEVERENPEQPMDDGVIKSIVDQGSKAARVAIKVAGNSYAAIASSLHVSRLSSFGFLLEAHEREIEQYKISAVMDGRTCPVCMEMDGNVFPVPAGMAQATSIMSVTDPDALRTVAPWPSRSRDSLEVLGRMNIGDKIDGGLALPPYHPGCRCIIVRANDDGGGVGLVSGATRALLGAITGLTQGEHLLGDFSSIRNTRPESSVGVEIAPDS